MAIQSVDQVRCVGCGNCVENCPMDVFRLDEDTGKAQVVYPEDCAMCFICEESCDENAIILTLEVAEKMVFPFDRSRSADET